MAADEVRALGYRMHEAFNTGNLAAADEIFAPGFVSHPLGTVGAESVKRSWSSMQRRFPELRSVVEDVLVDGDKAAMRSTLHGVQPTASRRLPEIIEVYRVENGRIAELWGVTTLAP
jgi:predicted SnoaL-like aldol condensation-catalyzing enzyme